MAVLTEQMLRRLVRENKSKKISISPNTVLTPSAREYINDQALIIDQEVTEEVEEKAPVEEKHLRQDQKNLPVSYPYRFYGSEARFKEKPEEMTALYGQELVYKDYPRIRFRGKVDSLEAEILVTIGELKSTAKEEVLQGLVEIYQYVRQLLKAEVTGEQLQDLLLLGKDADEIREITHSPQKYFNRGHFILEGEEKMETLRINRLRAKVREVEVEAIEPFSRIPGQERKDVLKALNRLSSAFYYLMFLSEGGE